MHQRCASLHVFMLEGARRKVSGCIWVVNRLLWLVDHPLLCRVPWDIPCWVYELVAPSWGWFTLHVGHLIHVKWMWAIERKQKLIQGLILLLGVLERNMVAWELVGPIVVVGPVWWAHKLHFLHLAWISIGIVMDMWNLLFDKICSWYAYLPFILRLLMVFLFMWKCDIFTINSAVTRRSFKVVNL
jgi:hypothetical protein